MLHTRFYNHTHRTKLSQVGRSASLLGLILALLITPTWAGAQAVAQNEAQLNVSPALSTISVGDTVTVSVRVENVSELAAVEMRLGYTSTVLKYISASEGDFFTPAPGTVKTKDYTGIFEYKADAQQATTGSGVLFTIQFKALAEGTAHLTLSAVFLWNDAGGAITVVSTGGKVTVGAASGVTITPTDTPAPIHTPTPTITSTTPPSGPTPTFTTLPPSLTPTVPQQSGAAAVSIALTPVQIAAGENVVVSVQIQNVSGLGLVEMQLAYNAVMLEFVSITEGSFFTPKPGSLKKDQMSANVLRYEAEAQPAASGNGELVSIVFKGRSAGTADLVFSHLFLGNSQGGGIVATSQNSQINIIGTPAASSPTPTDTPTPTFTPTPSSTPTGYSTPATVSPTPTFSPTPSPTPQPTCTLPACPAGQALYCPDTCPGGCGYICVASTPSSPTPSATVWPVCTPPACPAGQVLYCPGICPGGCGVVCTTPTPYPTVITPATITPKPLPTLNVPDIGVHVVARGETLYCLGRAYLVNPLSIARRNGLPASGFIYPGQPLAIPGDHWVGIPNGRVCLRQFAPPDTFPTPAPSTPAPVATGAPPPVCPNSYTIRPGDTLWSIARRYGKSPWAIATYNHIFNYDLIFVGDVLCIP